MKVKEFIQYRRNVYKHLLVYGGAIMVLNLITEAENSNVF